MRALTLSLLLALTVSCESEPEQIDHRFSWEESVSGMHHALLGACANDQGGVYAVGGLYAQGALYRFTSQRWIQEAGTLGGERLRSCWAGSAQRVFAVGQAGNIYRHNAEGWFRDVLPEELRSATLYSVWGMPDGSAVAVGGGLPGRTDTAVILHFDGQEWTRADASHVATKTLRGVWGSDGLYWAVGDDGAITHFNGEAWVPSPSRVNDRLNGIHGVSRTEIFAVGGTGRGLVLRWNGSSWLHFDEPASSLQSAWTNSDRALYVAGDAGFVARYTRMDGLPTAEQIESAVPFPHLRVHSIIGLGSALLGAAATMETDDDGDWRGSVVGHKRSFAGPVFESSAPQPPDAGVADAGTDDAGADDAGADAATTAR